MADFNAEHKEEMGGSYFPVGIHKVQIMLFDFGVTEKDQEYVEITVVDPEDDERTAKTRLWFTTDGAIKYTFNVIRTIFVHNAPEKSKDAMRKKVDELKNTKELEKACDKLIGKEAWLQVWEDPERTYIDNSGKERPSINRDITGYEPKPRKVEPAAAAPAGDGDTGPSPDEDGEDVMGF